jgi:DNA-binding MarR family transcriptional regulator
MADDDVRDEDYTTLATFRYELRNFLHFSENAAAEAGLTAQQHQALLALRGVPGGSMLVGELAERLLLRPHSASGLVDRLMGLGLVERNREDDDRRQVRILLTETGRKVLASLAASHRAELRRLRPLLTELMRRL